MQYLDAVTDTIKPGQSISKLETIISAGGEFELGFFSPGNSRNYFVGIWYKKVNVQTVVWVANREQPLTSPSGILTINMEGNLVVLDGNKSYPVSDVSSVKNTSATLLDSGNLILRDSKSQILWQSFDYPSDTFLPGMRIGYNKKTGKACHDERGHIKSLNITIVCKSMVIARVLINNGSALNICPWVTVQRLGMDESHIYPNGMTVRGFDNSKREVMGGIEMPVTVGPYTFDITFQVVKIPAAFNLLLGRPWIHTAGAVPSTLHQRVKYIVDNQLVTVLAEEDLLVQPSPDIPYIDMELSKDQSMFHSFEIVSAIDISVMKEPKLGNVDLMVARVMMDKGFQPGKGLGLNSQGIPEPIPETTYIPWFGLGYKPKGKDWIEREKKVRERRRARLEGRESRERLGPIPHIRETFPRSTYFILPDTQPHEYLNLSSLSHSSPSVSIYPNPVVMHETMNINEPTLLVSEASFEEDDWMNDEELMQQLFEEEQEREMKEFVMEAPPTMNQEDIPALDEEEEFLNQFPRSTDAEVTKTKNFQAWELWKSDRALELMDPILSLPSSTSMMLRYINVGLLCVQENAADRPTMSDVVSVLSNELTPLPIPKQPAFFAGRSVIDANLHSKGSGTCSINESQVGQSLQQQGLMASDNNNYVQPAIPRFDGHYDHWSMLMENFLRSKEYWSLVETGFVELANGVVLTEAQRKITWSWGDNGTGHQILANFDNEDEARRHQLEANEQHSPDSVPTVSQNPPVVDMDESSSVQPDILTSTSPQRTRTRPAWMTDYEDLTNDGMIDLIYCRSEDQVADILTKPLKLVMFLKLRKLLVVCTLEDSI
ncbi:hypothetical protein HHK36_005485 [Tetracentron sinense]|uniref:G-patch domain-containing protein n=1 Tax=Tetracentron sinense TaxID=13715 RepID=A0A834ZKR6_TETSI|nr:hypothetical protein HHK36_005485 [Tetracentron sinense]